MTPVSKAGGLGYIDVDHVVLPVQAFDDAVRTLGDWGFAAAPQQRHGDGAPGEVGEPIEGLRHFVFAPAAGRDDVANMLVLVDAAPGRPAPPGPVLVCAGDLEHVRREMEARGIAAGEVESVTPRMWIDETTGERFSVVASRLGMRAVPFAVNGTHGGELGGYHHRPWQQHSGGVRRIVGVSIETNDPRGLASWLSEAVFGRPVHEAGSETLVLWPRDLFVRIVPGGGPAAAMKAVTLLAEPGGEARQLSSPQLPVEFEVVGREALAQMPGWPGTT